MVMPIFLLSIGVAMSVFASALWNAGQLAMTSGNKRMAHMLVVGLNIAILASLGLSAPETPVRVLAAVLIAAGVFICVSERMKYWPVCAVQIGFGALVASGLPYTLA